MEVHNKRRTWTSKFLSYHDHLTHRFDTTTDTARKFRDKSKSSSLKGRTNTHYNYYSEDPMRNCKSKSKQRSAASSIPSRSVAINRFQYRQCNCIMLILPHTNAGKLLSWTSKKNKVTTSSIITSINAWKKK